MDRCRGLDAQSELNRRGAAAQLLPRMYLQLQNERFDLITTSHCAWVTIQFWKNWP